MPTSARFFWQVALGLAVGLAAIVLVRLFDSIWPGIVFLLVWIVLSRIWWIRRRPRQGPR